MLKATLQVRTENGGVMALAAQWEDGRTSKRKVSVCRPAALVHTGEGTILHIFDHLNTHHPADLHMCKRAYVTYTVRINYEGYV